MKINTWYSSGVLYTETAYVEFEAHLTAWGPRPGPSHAPYGPYRELWISYPGESASREFETLFRVDSCHQDPTPEDYEKETKTLLEKLESNNWSRPSLAFAGYPKRVVKHFARLLLTRAVLDRLDIF